MATKTQDELVLLEPIIERYSVARHLDASEQKELYEEINEIVEKDYKNSPAFQTYWEFNEETGEINGSNLPRLILANKVLAKDGKRTLTYDEGMKLDKEEKLTNEVYREFGLAVYGLGAPNEELAKSLVEEAEKKGWELPVLAHPSSLEIPKRKSNNSYGIDILFSDDDSLIVSGEAAQEELKRFNYAGNSGVRGLFRYWGGLWYAYWFDLADSIGDGRVDWVRGEATRADLESELLSEIDMLGRDKLEDIHKKIITAKKSALKIMKS